MLIEHNMGKGFGNEAIRVYGMILTSESSRYMYIASRNQILSGPILNSLYFLKI